MTCSWSHSSGSKRLRCRHWSIARDGGGIHVEAVAPAGLGGIKALAADALPALIVITACLGAFGPPPTSSHRASTLVAT